MAWNFLEKLTSVGRRWSENVTSVFGRSNVNEEFWEELEENLIMGDVGAELSEDLTEGLRRCWNQGKANNAAQLKQLFAKQLIDRLASLPLTGQPIRLGTELTVLLLTGVNGSGKTTTAGKLAHHYSREGKKVVLAAADTFRAAAPQQLAKWGERSGVRVVSRGEGVDPVSVVYDGISAAKSDKADLVIVDTAGRLQSRANLMSELGKMYNIAERAVGKEHLENLIVLDSVIGQNAYTQAQLFNDVAPLTGAVLAKYDNTAKGGIVLSISDTLKIPVRYVGLGEGIDDLQPFNPQAFVATLLGLEEEK